MDTSSGEPLSDTLLLCFFMDEVSLTNEQLLTPLTYTVTIANCVGYLAIWLT